MSLKISQMTSGSPALSTDMIPVARVGSTTPFQVPVSSIVSQGTPSPVISLMINQSTSVPIANDPVFNTGGGRWNNGVSNAINPTVNHQGGQQMISAATASTVTVLGMSIAQNGNNSLIGMLSINRYSATMALGSLTNTRWWTGLGCWSNISTAGNNNQAINSGSVGTAAYTSDTPNKTTIGFRYSSGTDVNFKAVVITANGSGGAQTVLDTGIVADTGIHLFEWVPIANGTQIAFYIDGASVGTISTNIPNPASGIDSWGTMFWTCDNKNTANAVTVSFYAMRTAIKV